MKKLLSQAVSSQNHGAVFLLFLPVELTEVDFVRMSIAGWLALVEGLIGDEVCACVESWGADVEVAPCSGL